MSWLNRTYGIKTEGRVMDKIIVPDVIEKKEEGGKRGIIIQHGKGGIMLYADFVFLLIVLGALRDVSGLADYFWASILLLIFFLPQIGLYSQKTYITKNLIDGSFTIRAKSINEENTRIYSKDDNVRLQLFRFFRFDETVPERVSIAILSGENIMFLPFAVPSFLFYPYGRYGKSDSNLVRLKIDEARSAIEFLGLPLEERIGELDYSGKIDRI